MSPRLRRRSAREVLAVLQGFGFEVVATRGSLVKLRRELPDGSRQVLTIPLHRELARWSLELAASARRLQLQLQLQLASQLAG